MKHLFYISTLIILTASSMANFPHYKHVPKDLDENIRFRKSLLARAGRDAGFAHRVHELCAEDVLFYINTFCFTYDPRQTGVGESPVIPFVTYEFQDEAINELVDAITIGQDIAFPKSRCMGASWVGLTTFEWFWHFRKALSFGLISRNEDYVDKKGDSKCLFWKIDFLHENQPTWLLPPGRELGWNDPNRRLLILTNAETGSVISGESTTGDIFRGGRLTALFIDEHASFDINDGFRTLRATRDVTKCRAFNSTPQGANNAFYDVVHETSAKIVRMHWTKHPVYNRGLYTSTKRTDGSYELKIIDTSYSAVVAVNRKRSSELKKCRFPEEYPFILDGKTRSPWYDNECARCATDMEIAQELDIDFLGSDYQFFDPSRVDALIAEHCRAPDLIGDLVFDSETCEPTDFVENPDGNLSLWLKLDRRGRPPEGMQYVLGSDVSAGTGASNSVTSIAERDSGQKVGVWRNSHFRPINFADITIALAKFFNNGMMIWDASGPTGRTFTMRVLDKRYANIYYRQNEDRMNRRISDQPGYFIKGDTRGALLQNYRNALDASMYINPSEQGMKECLQFIVHPGGDVEHSAAANSQDPSGARTAHGDEVIADALAAQVVRTAVAINRKRPHSQEPPIGSLAWRRKQTDKERHKLSAASELSEGW